jgi:F-type H+-transporting ATPase subunit b
MLPTVLALADLTEVNPGLIFYTLITFVLLALVLRRVAWGPILKLVEDREKAISDTIDGAKRDRSEAERLLAEQKNANADFRREVADMMKQKKEEADRLHEQRMAESKKAADDLIQGARRQIEDEKQKALAEVKVQAVDLALKAASKLLSANLDDAKQRQLVQEYLDKLPKEQLQ